MVIRSPDGTAAFANGDRRCTLGTLLGIDFAHDDAIAADFDDPYLASALDERAVGDHVEVFFAEDRLARRPQRRVGHTPIPDIGLESSRWWQWFSLVIARRRLRAGRGSQHEPIENGDRPVEVAEDGHTDQGDGS